MARMSKKKDEAVPAAPKPTRKLKMVPQEEAVQAVPVGPSIQDPTAEICWNCKWYAAGPTVYMGPHCQNPASPQFRQRMVETGTCDEFEARARNVKPGSAPFRAKVKDAKAIDPRTGLYGEGERTLTAEEAKAPNPLDKIDHDIFDEEQ